MTQTLMKRFFGFLGSSDELVPDLTANLTPEQEAKLWLSFTGGAGESSRLMTFDELLEFAPFRELYDDLQTAYGDTKERFIEHARPLLRVVFDYVQLIPASRNDHHKMPGGLMYHLMHVALLVLRDSQGLQGYRPLGIEIRHPLRKEFVYWGRLGLFAAALCHDIGKVAWDVNVKFQSLPDSTPIYSPHDGGKRYSVSFTDFAKRHYSNVSEAQYVWEYRRKYRDRYKHMEDWADITRAMLDHSRVPIPVDIRQFFLPDSEHFYSPRPDSPSIYNRICQLDKQSGISDFNAEQEDARSGREEKAIACMLDCWSQILALKDMDLIDWFGQCRMFIPRSDAPRLLSLLPDSPHFDGAKRDPKHPESFMRGIIASQKEIAGQEMKLVDGKHHVHPETGEIGVFLSVTRTGNYAAWQAPYLRAAYPQVFSSHTGAEAIDPSNNVDAIPDVYEDIASQQSPEPAQEAKSKTAHTASKDVSSLGASIQSPPNSGEVPVAVVSQESFDLAPELAEHNRLAESMPDGLKTLIFHFETKDPEDFFDEAFFRIEDGCLVVLKPYLRPVLDELEALRFDVRECRKAAGIHCVKQFVLLPEPTTEMRLTREYTKAILDKHSTSGLLFGIEPVSVKEIDPYVKKTHSKKPAAARNAKDDALIAQETTTESDSLSKPIKERREPPHNSYHVEVSTEDAALIVQEPQRSADDPISADGFLAYLMAIHCGLGSASLVSFVDHLVQIPEAYVDSYVVHKMRRGHLINELTNHGMFARRDKAKGMWFLTTSNSEVASWANELRKK